jgi:hypothetical protein
VKQLLPIPLITIGHKGLNKAESSLTTISPDWASELQNAVFDDSGRMASRKGWLVQNATPITGAPNVVAMTENVTAAGATAVLSAANLKLYEGTSTLTDRTGALTPTGNNWQFVQFMDITYGFQQSHTPIQWTPGGNAAVMTAADGTLPTGNCVCAAFGRLWALDADGTTIKYCTLLGPTHWGAAGSGSINMVSIWTHGTDTVQGIYAFGAALAVFGKRQIVIFKDGAPGTNANLGMNPSTMIVSDTIEGTGLLGRDTVQSIGEGDLWYLSPTGVQSLARVIAQKNNPLQSLDPQTREYIYGYSGSENTSAMRSIYSPQDRFYLVILPASGRCFCYDTRKQNDDGTARVSEWTHMAPFCAVTRQNRSVLMGFAGGLLGQYTSYQDNLTNYRFVYASLNLSIGPDYENKRKIIKALRSIVFTTAASTVVYQWGVDFQGLNATSNYPLLGGQIPEYNTAEYGANGVYNITDATAVAGVNVSYYGGGLALSNVNISAGGTGRWLQFGIQMDINGASLAIQELDAYVKIGNLQ